MNELLIQVLAGIIVVTLSGMAGFFFRSRFIQEGLILPRGRHSTETQSYSHLNGQWHLYWISFTASEPSQPVWMHALQELQVEKNSVKGKTQFDNHPHLTTYSVIRGDILSGRMIVVDVYAGDETEFAAIIYPNLRSGTRLVGIWNGIDNLFRPIAAPAVLNRDAMDESTLNKVLKDTPMSFVTKGEYHLYKNT